MWADVMNLTVTEFNSTWADIVIGFYPINHNDGSFRASSLAHAWGPGPFQMSGDIHIRADLPFSAFSSQGMEFEMTGLLKVVCLSMTMSACVHVSVSVCASY